ncbi:MAG: hypothetical protein PHQ12_01535 [Chthoniobacteraceae bacterium]|nr:hypothetical protein [Chthoniobacteraceae bacterium]
MCRLPWRRLRRTLAAAALGLAAWATAGADPVKIVFLPPPMEGNISLGVYDAAGTLVRVLYREAPWGDFTAGDDGFAVQWDGKDDHGVVCPPGTYRVRGVAVGDVGVEGVDFTGNDWVTSDDAPHLKRITGLGTKADGTLVISAALPGQSAPAFFAVAIKPPDKTGEEAELQLSPQPGLPASAPATGTHNAPWTIDGTTVKQATESGNVLRKLSPAEGEPPPVKLAASPKNDKLFVLYEDADLQRVRGYDFAGVKPGAAPKVLFENDIVFSDRYEQVAAELKFPDDKPFTASPVLSVALQPNPLAGNKPGTLLIRAAVDKEGTYLATADGLPLCHVSDTKAAVWAVVGRPAGSKVMTVFDSDGAVVEQFRVSKIANMMTFDAGAVQWTVPAATPATSPSATPSPAPSATPGPAVSAPPAPAATSAPSSQTGESAPPPVRPSR